MANVFKKLAKGAKKVFKGVKKVASQVNPLFGAGYDALGGKGAKEIGQNFVDRNVTNAKIAGPMLAAGLAAPVIGGAVGAAGGAGGAAGAAGGAGGIMGTLGKVANSPLTPALLDFAGSTIAGIGQGRQAADDRNENRRQFDLEYGLRKRDADAEEAERQRRLQMLQASAPMREQIMQLVAARLGSGGGAMPGGPPMSPPMGAPTQAPVPPGMGPQIQSLLQRMRERF
jgi:hypothetical protein